jgi:ATP-dependent DNA helicase RecG
LFEDLPARDQRAEDRFLREVDRCDLLIGIYGQQYGTENKAGLSATEREFDRAGVLGKPRLIFVRGRTDDGRHAKMVALIRKAGNELIRRRFADTPELTAAVYASLIEALEHEGVIQTGPFDASICPGATLRDLSAKAASRFLAVATAERNFPLPPRTPLLQLLKHLRLVVDDQPTYAAVLLFGKQPQRFVLTSSVKCLHFHGTEIEKPIPSYQTFGGTVFEMADQALDFVLSKIDLSVGTRAESVRVPVKYELPKAAIAEAIVNAIAHRDYASHASTQIMLFADRLEIWNPGQLPLPLTFESLLDAHPSIPRNPLIAEAMYLARYIERAGTGTLDITRLCKAAKLKPPQFRGALGQFVQTIYRASSAKVTAQATAQVTAQATAQVTAQAEAENEQIPGKLHAKLADVLQLSAAQVSRDLMTQAIIILELVASNSLPLDQLRIRAGLQHREHFRRFWLEAFLNANWIKRTIPDKPTSPAQKYRLTATGQRWLNQAHKSRNSNFPPRDGEAGMAK